MKYRDFFKIQEHSEYTVHMKIHNQDQMGIQTSLIDPTLLVCLGTEGVWGQAG